jgi:CBS-domain-containing membrane protein
VIVETWMTRGPLSCGPDTPIGEAAAELARRRIRRLLVLDHGHLVGIVTKSDLLKRPVGDPVRTVMSRELATVSSATPLELAARQMVERKIGALPVLDAGGHAIGILTESDAMRALIASITVAGPGVRLTFRVADPAPVIRFVVDAAARHRMQILAILVTNGDDGRRVLAKLTGVHGDALIDDAFRSGHAVLSTQRL